MLERAEQVIHGQYSEFSSMFWIVSHKLFPPVVYHHFLLSFLTFAIINHYNICSLILSCFNLSITYILCLSFGLGMVNKIWHIIDINKQVATI